MKRTVLTISSLLLAFIALFSFTNCKTSKAASKKDLIVLLHLERDLGPSYIEKTYADYEPSKIKKSNRTLNQYQVQFVCTEKEESKLLQALKADSKIIEVLVSSASGIEIQSGKNQKSSKVKIN